MLFMLKTDRMEWNAFPLMKIVYKIQMMKRLSSKNDQIENYNICKVKLTKILYYDNICM